MRRATSLTIHQSGIASPGSGKSARWRLIVRSELVTVPSFSPHAAAGRRTCAKAPVRSEEHTSELQSLMRISYAVFCLKKKNIKVQRSQIYTDSHTIYQLIRHIQRQYR